MLVNSEFSFKSVLYFQNVDWIKKCPSHGPHDCVLLHLFVSSLLEMWILLFAMTLSQLLLPHSGSSGSWARTQEVGITTPPSATEYFVTPLRGIWYKTENKHTTSHTAAFRFHPWCCECYLYHWVECTVFACFIRKMGMEIYIYKLQLMMVPRMDKIWRIT